MATVPSWAGKPCKPKTVVIPIFGRSVSFEAHAANAMCRAVTTAIKVSPKRAAKVHSIGTCNCRQTTGGHSWSSHAWCGAVDIDPAQNPFSSSGRLITDMTKPFIKAFKDEGFGWGGDWSSVKDAMHFSIALNEGGTVKPETFDKNLAKLCGQAWVNLTGGAGPAPVPPPVAPGKPAPPWDPSWAPFALERPAMKSAQIKTWQSRMKARGWTIVVDGYYGQASTTVCQAFQREKGLKVDGIVGPKTWASSWTEPIR